MLMGRYTRLVVPFECALLLLGSAASAQDSGLAGTWELALDAGRSIDYGILEIEEADGEWQGFIDGGPVNLLGLDGNRVSFDFDWTDAGDSLHITVLSGELVGERLSGELTEEGEPSGTWSAEPWAAHPDVGAAPDPIDLTGVWRSVSRGTHKDAFALTAAGQTMNDAYDRTLDDPHLRCVSGGLIRMEDGPFDYEIIDRGDHILILYEYFQESRRVWMDGRGFPEAIEDAYLAMGYSVGHWEGETLVIETRGMKPTVWDAAGMPVSAAAVIRERKYLDEAGRLHTDYVLEDPAHYERPVYRHAYRAPRPGSGLAEYVCDPHTFYRGLQLEGRLDEYWESSDRF